MIYNNCKVSKKYLIKALNQKHKIIAELKKENEELKIRIKGIDKICKATSKYREVVL